MAKIGLYRWVRENRKEIDEAIHRICPGISLNDEDRRQWIYNDPGLYGWARSEGVNI